MNTFKCGIKNPIFGILTDWSLSRLCAAIGLKEKLYIQRIPKLELKSEYKNIFLFV